MSLSNKTLRSNASLQGLAEYARHVLTVAESERRYFYKVSNEAPYNSDDLKWARDKIETTYPYVDELQKITEHLERIAAK